jgi:hypothetical protein
MDDLTDSRTDDGIGRLAMDAENDDLYRRLIDVVVVAVATAAALILRSRSNNSLPSPEEAEQELLVVIDNFFKPSGIRRNRRDCDATTLSENVVIAARTGGFFKK